MLRRSGLRLGSQLLRAAAACGQAASEQLLAQTTTMHQTSGPVSSNLQPAMEHLASRPALPWQLRSASSGGGGSSVAAASDGGSGSSKAKRRGGSKSRTAEPQPELQAWLEQQHGLPEAAADEHARRLARVFGSQQAALDGLPATFAFCARQGLSGLQTAQLLDSLARERRDKVTSFAATTQHEWLQLEACIAAHVQRQRQAVKQLPKHTSFASVAVKNVAFAAQALCMPPGHVEAWLAAVLQRLSKADIGRLLLKVPHVPSLNPEATLAVMAWAADVLQVPAAELGTFLAEAPRLLTTQLPTVQGRWAALRQALQQCGLPPGLAVQLARKEPRLVTANSGTVQAVAAWLQRLFTEPAQLQPVLELCPLLLVYRSDKFDHNAAYLRRELGWQPGDGQLAAYVQQYPQSFASLDLEGPEVQARLLLLTDVVGAGRADCLTKWSSYLRCRLETLAARYMLVQERAPWLLYDKDGALSLSWMNNAPTLLPSCGAATKAEVLAFEREWPRSEQGRRLLAALRSGSTEGWPRPGLSPSEAIEQRRQADAQLKARRAGACEGRGGRAGGGKGGAACSKGGAAAGTGSKPGSRPGRSRH